MDYGASRRSDETQIAMPPIASHSTASCVLLLMTGMHIQQSRLLRRRYAPQQIRFKRAEAH
eukprot:scaffold333138_cov33-Prasinocladus_malaysianus.AAC.3